jgi:hypothetical protein
MFTWSTWWNVAFLATFNITMVEVCNLEIYIAYFMAIILFSVIAYKYLLIVFELFIFIMAKVDNYTSLKCYFYDDICG